MSRTKPMCRQVATCCLLPVLLTASLASAQESTASGFPAIKVDVRLVSLNVTVTDKNGRPFQGLNRNNFRLFDNGVEQAIHHFTAEDRPYTLGLVLDRSGSMVDMIEEVYQAAFHTILASKPEDEFFIATFNDERELRQEFSSDRVLLQRGLKNVRAGGYTGLYDALLWAMDHVQAGRHDKKALLVVTDGADNRSSHTFRQLLERARREELTIYVVGMFGREGMLGEGTQRDALEALLTELAETTGGKAYFPRNIEECRQACIAIADELRAQYTLGFYPRPKPKNSGWHAVQVQLNLDESQYETGLRAQTRTGYYVAGQ